MLKIALTGAHGTGKTTLVRRLQSSLAPLGRLAFCREAPRLIIERVGNEHFFRRGNNTPTRQALIFLEHMIEEQRRAEECDILITDRTLVDHLAYTAVLFPRRRTRQSSMSIVNCRLKPLIIMRQSSSCRSSSRSSTTA